MNQPLKDWTLLLLVNLMWAAQFPAYKVASEQMGALTLTAFCFVFAALLLIPFLLRRRLLSRTLARQAFEGNRVGILMTGVLGLVPASAMMAWGTERSTASNAAILSLSVPLITALLAWVVLSERMTTLRWISLAISLCGVLVLSGFDLRQADFTGRRFLVGNLFILAACTSSSLYNVYSKELLERLSQLEVLFYGYAIAAVVSLSMAFTLEPVSWAAIAGYRWPVWLSVLILAGMSWGVAMLLWMNLLTRLAVTQASVSIYLLPVLGVLISFLTLGERMTAAMWAGGAITLAGTLLATWPEKTTS